MTFFSAKKSENGIYPYGEDELLIATRHEGLYIYNKREGVREFETAADAYLLQNKIYDGHFLENGNYALATMANGIVVVTPEGNEIFRFDSSNGLRNNQTLYVREVAGQLWLGTKNGIFQLAYNAPFKSVEDEFGLNGQVSGIFRRGAEMYVTCNDGFYQLDKKTLRFSRVNRQVIVDCVNLFDIGENMLVSSLEGIFQYEAGELIEKSTFPLREIVPTSRKDVYLASRFYFGLSLLYTTNGEYRGVSLPQINRYVEQIIPEGVNTYHVRTIDDKYYFLKLNFDTNEPKVEILNERKLSAGTHLIKLSNGVGLINGNGLSLLKEQVSTVASKVDFQRKPMSIVATASLTDEQCLICYEDELKSFFCEKFKQTTDNRLTSTREYLYTDFKPTAVFEDPVDKTLWIGGATGVWMFKSSGGLERPFLQKSQTLIRQLRLNSDSVIYTNPEDQHTFRYDENNVEIAFVSNVSMNTGKVFYQYRLSGIRDSWSEWSENKQVVFNGLSPGDYLFEVRSTSPYVGLTVPATLRFTIGKPWYLTIWAYLLFLMAVSLLIYLLYRIRVRRLIRNQQELSDKVLSTTAQLAKANATLHEKNITLEKLGEFKSRFFANVSHDLRTPIMLLSGRVEMLKTDQDTFLSQKGEEYVKKLEEDSHKLVILTDEIRELVRMEQGRIELSYKVADVNPFFERIVGLFDSAASQRAIKLSFSSKVPEHIKVLIDPHYIERLMYNLIANALKFTRAGGEIGVFLEEAEASLVIKVRDNGVGIPATDIAEVFNRNFQAGNQHGLSEGLGIGLSLVKEIAMLHGGEVKVTSQREKGTEFVVNLPLDRDIEAESYQLIDVGRYIAERDVILKNPVIEENNLVPVNLSKKTLARPKLLLVEDNSSVRSYMKEIVEDTYEIYLAANGEEALNVLKHYEINVIVTDLMMPVMDGFEFIKGVKDTFEYQSIPVMVVSARDSKEDRYRIMNMGVNTILTKPFDKKELLLNIKNLLQDNQQETLTLRKLTDYVGEQHKGQLSKLNELIIEHIADFNFKIGYLADQFHLSERSFFRHIKNMTGKSPLEYVKDVKFQYAHDLLVNRKVRSLKEVSYAIGMKNTSDFNKQFYKRFGKKADELLKG
ncbi:MAG: ATP-binding protein [Bacteroidota bacterium]